MSKTIHPRLCAGIRLTERRASPAAHRRAGTRKTLSIDIVLRRGLSRPARSAALAHAPTSSLPQHALHRAQLPQAGAGQPLGSTALCKSSRARTGKRLSCVLASSSLRRRLSRPRQVRRSSTHVTSSQQSHTQHAGCRSAGPWCGLSRLRLHPAQVRHSGDFTSSSAAARIRALCSGTHPGRLQDGAANGTSAGASTLDLPGKPQAQCGASLPPHNLSCTQAIAVVRPFAVRSRHR